MKISSNIIEVSLFLSYVTTHSPLVRLVPMTEKTSEGREMLLAHLSTNHDASPAKPAIWIEGGIHAREWLSPAVVMYITNALIKGRNLSA